MKNKIKESLFLFNHESPARLSLLYLAKELISRFSLKNTFISLRYRHYRLWFWGQMISLFGTWMQGTALSFFIFELTHSSAYLGYMGFATGLPMWFFASYGGVIADRFSRRSLLLATQSFMMLLALVLSALTFTQVIQPWFMLILAFFLGVAQAFDAPARQALVAELVPREDLTNAIALNSTMVNMAFFLGPAISGLIYTFFGPAWCFLINGLSFLAVIIALIMIKLQPLRKKETGNSVFEDFRQGLKYLRQQPLILALIAHIALLSFFGSGTLTLLPAWAVKILHGDARTNGWLQSARGLGALVAALFIASLGRFHFRGGLLTVGAFSLPFLMIIFSFVSHLGLSLLILFMAGMAIIVVANLSNSLVQGLVDDSIRGRVMGLYALAFFGFMPLGSLWIGQIAEMLGERQAVLLNAGLLLIFLTSIWLLRPEIKKLE